MPPADPLKDLLELVRTAARDGVVEGLQAHAPAAPKAVTPLIDKKTVAHALSVSIATIDRLCRDERIPFVQVGDVRRFDLEAVREALWASAPGPVKVERPAPPAQSATARAEEAPIPGVRLLSRNGGSR
jgi:excisionase family DNA binding protein